MRESGTRRRRALLLSAASVPALVLSLGAAAPVLADQSVSLVAPYDSTYQQAYCYPNAGTCSASDTPDASTGRITSSLSVTAPTAGAADNGNGNANGEVDAHYTLATPAASITVTLDLHVSSVDLAFAGAIARGSEADDAVLLSADDQPCAGEGCLSNASRRMLSTADGVPASLSNVDVTETVTLVNQGGVNLPPGDILLEAGVAGRVGMGTGDQGTISNDTDVTVTSMTLDIAPPLTVTSQATDSYAGGFAELDESKGALGQPGDISCASPLAGTTVGMDCFTVPSGAVALDMTVADPASPAPAFVYAFFAADGSSAGYRGYACGGYGQARVPAGAATVAVYLAESPLPVPCGDTNTPVTAGTVTARFYS